MSDNAPKAKERFCWYCGQSIADEGEPAAMRAACDFEHDGFRLTDFWEVDCRKYTVQFIWSLYAISWAIKQYDARDPAKSAAA